MKFFLLFFLSFNLSTFGQYVPKEVFEINHPEFPNTVKSSNNYLNKEMFVHNNLKLINDGIDNRIISELNLIDEDIVTFELGYKIDMKGELKKESLNVNFGGLKSLENNIENIFSKYPKLKPATDLKHKPIEYNFQMTVELIVFNEKFYVNKFYDKSFSKNFLRYKNIKFPNHNFECNKYKLINGQTIPAEVCFNKYITELIYKNIKYPKNLQYECSNCYVTASFILKKDGSLDNIVVLFDRSKGSSKFAKPFEDEVVNAILKLPKLNPVEDFDSPIDYKIVTSINIK